ncbi:MAG: WG repeat-containing protein [Clostridium sp.]|uniref:WG repeat-containing protein n=1 Tax=Clostridium sp. TaxID=1506 RepID=UPI003EE49F07
MNDKLKNIISPLNNKKAKGILAVVIILLLCAIIIFIGNPTEKKVSPPPLTPLVFQNANSGLYGAIDTKRNVIITPEYKTLLSHELDGEYYFVGTTQNNDTVILNNEGTILDTLPSSYTNVSVLSLKDKLLKVSNKSGLFGVLNFSNNVIVPIQYNSLSLKNNFLILNPLSNESIANINGKILASSSEYASISIQDNGIVVQNNQGLYGLLDFNGDVALPIEYTNIHGIYQNTFAVSNKSNLFAVYNISNKDFKSDFKYTSIQKEASESPFLASKISGGVLKYGYIDSNDSTIIPFIFQSAYNFNGDYAIVQKNGYFGLIDKTGDFLIDPEYSVIPGYAYAIESFQNGNYYACYKNNASYIIDSKGKILGSVPGVIETISDQTVLYETPSNQVFLYDLGTKKTTSSKFYLEPLTNGTVTPKGYFGAYKSVATSKYANSLYLYEENKGILSYNGYNSIKFENGLFLCKSETRYDVLNTNGQVILSFNPVRILSINITPDKIIYVQKVAPGVNRMESSGPKQEATRSITAYNFNGQQISLSNLKEAGK